jgi:hypothetical protein
VSIESFDVGYWTGEITYSPAWSSVPISISFGSGPDPVYGISWIIEKLEGWDSPDIVGQVLQRGADHGGWPAGQWYAPRALTLQVRASAPTQATRDIARALFQQVCPPSDLSLFQYNEPIPKQVYFRRAGKISETYDNLTEVDFAAVLICPDPRKYSQQLKSWTPTIYAANTYTTVGNTGTPTFVPWPIGTSNYPAVVSAPNLGTFETRPVVLLQGPLTKPGIRYVNTGQVVTWSNVTLRTGDVMAIDFDSHTSYVNPGNLIINVPLGVAPSAAVVAGGIVSPATIAGYVPADISSSWFVLWPGYNALQLLTLGNVSTDVGLMQVFHRDAWI